MHRWRRLHYGLHCIVDTAGKSLHAWFEAPSSKVLKNRLKAGLEVFGSDPKVLLTRSRCGCRGRGGMGSCNDSYGSGTSANEYEFSHAKTPRRQGEEVIARGCFWGGRR